MAACYGWPRSGAQDDAGVARRLVARNASVASGSRPYDPFRAPPD